MNAGTLFIVLATVLVVVSLAGYALGFRKNKRTWPRRAFDASTVLLIVASAVLFEAILSHRFAYEYVASYSDRSLPTFYLISAFWAGQEGTFLLWAVLAGAIAYFVARRSGALEAPVMTALAINQIVLLAVTLLHSPFAELSFAPPDGRGLNELLRDPWMVIHPPVVFLGYAALAAPWAYAFAAAAKRDANAWTKPALAWAVFGSSVLGAGVFMGGFWAYKTLGWGGYWAWDPVENSSLVPWLTAAGMAHALLAVRASRGLSRVAIALAPVTYLLVIYATFLTRSGVLADFSVHSFADLGLSSHILVWIAVIAAASLWAVARLWKKAGVKAPPIPPSSATRETALAWGIGVVAALAALVFFGMSAPIYTGAAGKASSVQPAFYNRTALPVGIALVLLIASAPFTRWGAGTFSELAKRSAPSLAFGAAAGAVGIALGMRNALHVLFLFFGAACAFGNGWDAIAKLKRGWRTLGGPATHFGLGLMAMGIIATGGYTARERAVLPQGVPTAALGHTLTFMGYEFKGGGTADDWPVRVSGPREYVAHPEMYVARAMEGVMRNPDVHRTLLFDYYLAPLEYYPSDEAGGDVRALREFTPDTIAGLTVSFVGFDLSGHGGGMPSGVGALLEVRGGYEVDTIAPVLVVGEQGTTSEPVALPFVEDASVSLERMSVEERTVWVRILTAGGEGRARLVVEFMRQPLINVLWAGVALVVIGSLIASIRRFGDERRK